MTNIILPQDLSLEVIRTFLSQKVLVSISETNIIDIESSRNLIDSIVNKKDPVYGINTGFGKLATKHIEPKDLDRLQLNLIRSHTAGSGEELPQEIINIAMLLLANSLSRGYSGVRLHLIKKLVDILNSGFTPIVPKYGSLGASGDLIPLSHTISALLDEYPVRDKNKNIINRISDVNPSLVLEGGLKAKEGLALINGTHFTTATTVYSLLEFIKNIKHVYLGFSLAFDSILASIKPFSSKLNAIRSHPGQEWTARIIRSLLDGSELAMSHVNPSDDPRVQDPYSFRCFPQVMGGVIQAIVHAKNVLKIELKSVTDNPLVFANTEEIISGGNFHAEPVAMVADYLAIAITNLMGIMEKQIEKILNPAHNYNLPAFLSPNAGVNSGYMIAHFGQAALVNRAILLSKPSSVDNVSTSANQEDFVSMGMNSALKLYELNDLLTDFLSYYYLMVAQSLSLRKDQLHKNSSPYNEKLLLKIREHVPPMVEDRQIEPDLKTIKGLFTSGLLLENLNNTDLQEFDQWIIG